MHKLTSFLPENTLDFVQEWLKPYWVYLKIRKPRQTKLGDYRYLAQEKAHQITVNVDLEKPLFFLTLTHEIAHMHAFGTYGFRIAPHGKEWKVIFGRLILQTIDYYPIEMQADLLQYAKNPKAIFNRGTQLSRQLMPKKTDDTLYLEDLPIGSVFSLKEKIFKSIELRRTRYLCEEIRTRRRYLVNKMAEVTLVKS